MEFFLKFNNRGGSLFFSEEQGERFHQDIKTLENRYQERCDMHIMADYCWSLEKDCSKMYSRMAKRKKILNVH